MSKIETQIEMLGVVLPNASNPLGKFASSIIDDGYLYISGQISTDPNGEVQVGKIGETASIEYGIEAAKNCAIGILARAKAKLGDLDRIDRLVKLGAFVNAVPEFTAHPKVVDGASEFMEQVLGPAKAEHVRFAIGCASLPANASVEIEAVFKIVDLTLETG